MRLSSSLSIPCPPQPHAQFVIHSIRISSRSQPAPERIEISVRGQDLSVWCEELENDLVILPFIDRKAEIADLLMRVSAKPHALRAFEDHRGCRAYDPMRGALSEILGRIIDGMQGDRLGVVLHEYPDRLVALHQRAKPAA